MDCPIHSLALSDESDVVKMINLRGSLNANGLQRIPQHSGRVRSNLARIVKPQEVYIRQAARIQQERDFIVEVVCILFGAL